LANGRRGDGSKGAHGQPCLGLPASNVVQIGSGFRSSVAVPWISLDFGLLADSDRLILDIALYWDSQLGSKG
jgi:hypothetical protein